METTFCTHKGYNTVAPCGKDCPTNQPIEEKWKIDFRNRYYSDIILNGEKIPKHEMSNALLEDQESFIENLLEQERKKLVKRIDSFPLSDSMFFDENNWEAGYKALEEFKLSIINK